MNDQSHSRPLEVAVLCFYFNSRAKTSSTFGCYKLIRSMMSFLFFNTCKFQFSFDILFQIEVAEMPEDLTLV